MWQGLDRFAAMPPWLAALADPARVEAALRPAVPGLRRATLGEARLKRDAWTARCELTVAEAVAGGPPGERTTHRVATIVPPRALPGDGKPAHTTRGEGAAGPEARLVLAADADGDAPLPAMALLTDPERARELLERAIRAGAPAYRDLRVLAVTPRVMRYTPGSRCTVLYRLKLPTGADPAWPETVVAKTYHRSDKGQIAWEGMWALWSSPLARSELVRIAEPLAWLPELNVLVQGPVREERTLKDLLLEALTSGDRATLGALRAALSKTAAGLAALHRCGAPSARLATWDDEVAEVRQVLDRLAPRVPELAGAADPFLAGLGRLAARVPAAAPVPTHRSFRPAQVLLYRDELAFIDFDGFCHAEPALDLALFRATIRDLGIGAFPPGMPTEARLERLDQLCDEFLDAYQAHAGPPAERAAAGEHGGAARRGPAEPVARERVVLWEALDLFTNVLHAWTKIRPARLAHAITLLRHHVTGLEALAAQADSARRRRQ
jgi:hypothetical protein